MKWRIVWNYKGPERRLCARGPNWWQVTVPVMGRRVSLIMWRAAAVGE